MAETGKLPRWESREGPRHLKEKSCDTSSCHSSWCLNSGVPGESMARDHRLERGRPGGSITTSTWKERPQGAPQAHRLFRHQELEGQGNPPVGPMQLFRVREQRVGPEARVVPRLSAGAADRGSWESVVGQPLETLLAGLLKETKLRRRGGVHSGLFPSSAPLVLPACLNCGFM